MDPKIGDARALARGHETPPHARDALAIAMAKHPRTVRTVRRPKPHAVHKCTLCRQVERNAAPLARLGVPALEQDQVVLQIHPAPLELQQLVQATPGMQRQADEVRQVRGQALLTRDRYQPVCGELLFIPPWVFDTSLDNVIASDNHGYR